MSCKNPIEEYRLPTAEEFCKTFTPIGKSWQENFHQTMIEFAKLHCEAQLKAILENVKTKKDIAIFAEGTYEQTVVDENSIINAYDINQIK